MGEDREGGFGSGRWEGRYKGRGGFHREVREMDHYDSYWVDGDTDREPEGNWEVHTFDDGEREFWGENSQRASTNMEEVDLIENV